MAVHDPFKLGRRDRIRVADCHFSKGFVGPEGRQLSQIGDHFHLFVEDFGISQAGRAHGLIDIGRVHPGDNQLTDVFGREGLVHRADNMVDIGMADRYDVG